MKDADAYWDFISLSHETLHQVTILFSNRGTPHGYRHMDGFSSHTLKLVNAQGEAHLVKWHFKTDQGIKNWTAEEAAEMDKTNPDSSTEDLFNAIDKGDFPSWTVYLQVMREADAAHYKWNVFGTSLQSPLVSFFFARSCLLLYIVRPHFLHRRFSFFCIDSLLFHSASIIILTKAHFNFVELLFAFFVQNVVALFLSLKCKC